MEGKEEGKETEDVNITGKDKKEINREKRGN